MSMMEMLKESDPIVGYVLGIGMIIHVAMMLSSPEYLSKVENFISKVPILRKFIYDE